MRYVDFDGVILDTDEALFYEWRKNPDRHLLPIEDKIRYIQNSDWERILHESEEINNALYILKSSDPRDYQILTKVHSFEEGMAKVKFLREADVKQNVILVPYKLKKTDVVNAKFHVLIDDTLKNLDDWLLAGGYPMFFDLKMNNIDNFGQENIQGYQRVRRIDTKIRFK